MKRLFIVTVLGIGLLLTFSASSMAACSTVLCEGKVSRLYFSGDFLYIGTDGDEKALNCTSPGGTLVSIPASDQFIDEKYALLLTAVSLDKKVGIRINENSATCTVNYVYMNNP